VRLTGAIANHQKAALTIAMRSVSVAQGAAWGIILQKI
jgi:hypothetical protein